MYAQDVHQNFEVGPSNAKYRVIKFNFKYVPHSDPRRPLANKYIQHIQEASWV